MNKKYQDDRVDNTGVVKDEQNLTKDDECENCNKRKVNFPN
jgi:hypothetical protein